MAYLSGKKVKITASFKTRDNLNCSVKDFSFIFKPENTFRSHITEWQMQETKKSYVISTWGPLKHVLSSECDDKMDLKCLSVPIILDFSFLTPAILIQFYLTIHVGLREFSNIRCTHTITCSICAVDIASNPSTIYMFTSRLS